MAGQKRPQIRVLIVDDEADIRAPIGKVCAALVRIPPKNVTDVTVGSLRVSKPFPQLLVAIPIIVKGRRWPLLG